MFGLIINILSGKKRKIAQIAANIATVMNAQCLEIKRSNNGNLFSLFKDDNFLLGYITAMCHVSARFLGLNKPEHAGAIIISVHEHLFPQNRKYITDHCKAMTISKNDAYERGMQTGITEFYPFLKAVASNTNCSLSQLETHLTKGYNLSGDDEMENNGDFVSSMLKIRQLRDSIENIYKKYRLSEIDNSVTNKLEAEVIAISKFIAMQAIKRTGRNLSQLSDDEKFVGAMVCLIATDALTNIVDLEFEHVSTVALFSLLSDETEENRSVLIDEVINNYNDMIASDNTVKLITGIGTQVSKFFANAEEENLNSLSKIFEVMLTDLKPN
jgi:hypothetical protein